MSAKRGVRKHTPSPSHGGQGGGSELLTAANEKTKIVQEVLVTDRGELLAAKRAVSVAFVTPSSPMPATGPCRCVAVAVFASTMDGATLRVMDGGRSVPIMEASAIVGYWSSMTIPQGVASTGNLVATMYGENSYGYVYYIPD